MQNCSFALALLALPTPGLSQVPVPLLLEGDEILGVGNVVAISEAIVYNDANYLIQARTDHPNSQRDTVILSASGVRFREGQQVNAPVGATLDAFQSSELSSFGITTYGFRLDGSVTINDNAGVYRGDELLLQKGQPISAAGLPATATYWEFSDLHSSASSSPEDEVLLLRVRLIGGPSSNNQALVLFEPGHPGAGQATLLAMTGQVLPGQTETVFNILQSDVAGDASNPRYVYHVGLGQGAQAGDAIYLNDTVIAQEGSPSPVPDEDWWTFVGSSIDVNDSGESVVRARILQATGQNGLIAKNGAKFVQGGDRLAAIAPFVLSDLALSAPVILANTGDVLWLGQWDDGSSNQDAGLFVNHELVAWEGMDTAAGAPIDSFDTSYRAFHMSGDGLYVTFIATLTDGREGAFLLELGLGENYCVGAPAQGIGLPTRMAARGSASIAANDLTLHASPVPAQPGVLFYGPDQVQLPFGNGFRCVGGAVVRLSVTVPVGGVLEQPLDITGQGITPGRLNFQYWYRDVGGSPTTFNLTDALSIDFVP